MDGVSRGRSKAASMRAPGGPVLLAAWAVFAAAPAGPDPVPAPVLERNVLAHEEFLASDALHGRGSGTRDEWIAAVYVGSQLRQFGIDPAGDGGAGGKPGYVQAVPPGEGRKAATYNALGVLRGSDPKLGDEAILLSAHLDHLGADERRQGDGIFNGADDDASGVTAVLELARALGAGARPRRTVYFVCFGSEETGGAGARWFLDHPPVPLGRIAANLEFEMIGRPDGAVAAKTLWLTGWERSDLGPELAKQGARLVADPHPEKNFFERSDNFALAKRGVVAQTVSSYGLHPQYHRPDDDLAHLDVGHMTEAVDSMVKPVLWLANGDFRPKWNPGKKP
jgi:Zn-dependent M28 family amino/carboxypeptidase